MDDFIRAKIDNSFDRQGQVNFAETRQKIAKTIYYQELEKSGFIFARSMVGFQKKNGSGKSIPDMNKTEELANILRKEKNTIFLRMNDDLDRVVI